MKELEFIVLYKSETGNTAKVASAIFQALPGTNKDLVKIDLTRSLPKAKTYFIGFPVDKLSCPMEVADVLSELHHSRVALFATCGGAPTDSYKAAIEQNVSVWLEEDNEYLGFLLIQGKFSSINDLVLPTVVSRLQSLYHLSNENAEKMIRILLDESRLHPSAQDLQVATIFALDRAQSRLLTD